MQKQSDELTLGKKIDPRKPRLVTGRMARTLFDALANADILRKFPKGLEQFANLGADKLEAAKFMRKNPNHPWVVGVDLPGFMARMSEEARNMQNQYEQLGRNAFGQVGDVAGYSLAAGAGIGGLRAAHKLWKSRRASAPKREQDEVKKDEFSAMKMSMMKEAGYWDDAWNRGKAWMGGAATSMGQGAQYVAGKVGDGAGWVADKVTGGARAAGGAEKNPRFGWNYDPDIASYSSWTYPALVAALTLPGFGAYLGADILSDRARKSMLARRKEKAREEFQGLITDDLSKQSSVGRLVDQALDLLEGDPEVTTKSAEWPDRAVSATLAALLLLGAGSGVAGWHLGSADKDKSKELATLKALKARRLASRPPVIRLEPGAAKPKILSGASPVVVIPAGGFKGEPPPKHESFLPDEFSALKMSMLKEAGYWGDAWNRGKAWLGGATDSMGQGAKYLAGKVGDGAGWVADKVTGGAGAVGGAITGRIDDYVGNRSRVAADAFYDQTKKRLWGDIKAIPGAAWNAAKGFAGNVPGYLDRFGGWLQKTPGMVSSFWNQLTNAPKQLTAPAAAGAARLPAAFQAPVQPVTQAIEKEIGPTWTGLRDQLASNNNVFADAPVDLSSIGPRMV